MWPEPFVKLKTGSSDVKSSCNPGGGSPSTRTDLSRVTGPLLTVRTSARYRHCGLTSLKSMSDTGRGPRRVEWPSPKCSSKCWRRCCRLIRLSLAEVILQ